MKKGSSFLLYVPNTCIFVCLFSDSTRSNEYEVVSHYGFDLYFPSD